MRYQEGTEYLPACDALQVFGEQVSFGSPYGSPEVLDFPTYCACRFLDTAPDNPVSHKAIPRPPLWELCLQ